MKRFLFLGTVMIVLLLSGCNGSITENSDRYLTGDKPPNVIVEIDDEQYETILGSYCWEVSSDREATTECVDTAGPVELLKDKEPIQVSAGMQVKLKMDYRPKPNETQFYQIKSGDETKIELNNNQFVAPNEQGIYYYGYSVWWMDEKEDNLSHGDAFYAFVIEVN